jgi:uncharacterized protein (TIGR02147 family)
LRTISERLGLKSRSYFHRILIAPEKPLSDDVMENLITVLELSRSEADYFRALVGFAHADSLQQKNDEYIKMHRMLTLRQSGVLDAARFEYLSNWWLPALREVATFKDWKGDYALMGDALTPPLTQAQTRKGIELMLKLGILHQEGTLFMQTEQHIETGHDLHSLAIANYHRSILTLAHDAVENQPMEEREFGAITFGIQVSTFPRLKQKIRELQKELLQEACSESGAPEIVYQFGVQLFQLTRTPKISTRKTK